MTFTIENVANSIASHLQGVLPGVRFYEDPNQQGTKCPCAFIQLISSEVQMKRARYLLRTLRFDLTYLEDYNLPDLQRRYQRVSEVLDENMETFTYTAGHDSAVVRTYNRQSQIDLDGLHYKFDLQVWEEPTETPLPVRRLNAEVRVTNGN